MRYDDWDVLLFPSGKDSKIPVKEFKVNCHVLPDMETPHSGVSLGLPVMTCFVPSLQAGMPFHVSIHCWGDPEISQYTKNYSEHSDLVQFEARILIDGRMVASTCFGGKGQWPHLITSTARISKQGELEPLKFPPFHREITYQNHWNPGDEFGRVKVIISEGFPRDSMTTPIERVKNVVAFSFQHAPLDVLENNGVAWPNPQMWHRPLYIPSLPVPTYHPDDGADSHTHSPRRKITHGRSTQSSGYPMSFVTQPATLQNSNAYSLPVVHKNSTSSASDFFDPFSDAAYQDWVNSLQFQNQFDGKAAFSRCVSRKQSSTDTSMPDLPDYLSSHASQGLPAQMHISGPSLEDEVLVDHMQVPTNTPTTGEGDDNGATTHFTYTIPNTAISGQLAASLTQSLLNQPLPLPLHMQSVQPHQIPLPAPEVRSRKENRHFNHTSSHDSRPSGTASPSVDAQIRKFSQPSNAFGVIAGNDFAASSNSFPNLSRHASCTPLSTNMTNNVDANRTATSTPSSNLPSSGGDKGVKRNRNFTPASSRAIDEEDEPRRVSPRMRVATFPIGLDGQTVAEK